MMLRQRGVVGRTRVRPRHARHFTPAAGEEARLAEARLVAWRFVAAHWPELAAVTPIASGCARQAPSPELLARLGLKGDELAPTPVGALTFTFAAERPAPADTTTPMVANVTVDERLRIVKASVSR